MGAEGPQDWGAGGLGEGRRRRGSEGNAKAPRARLLENTAELPGSQVHTSDPGYRMWGCLVARGRGPLAAGAGPSCGKSGQRFSPVSCVLSLPPPALVPCEGVSLSLRTAVSPLRCRWRACCWWFGEQKEKAAFSQKAETKFWVYFFFFNQEI